MGPYRMRVVFSRTNRMWFAFYDQGLLRNYAYCTASSLDGIWTALAGYFASHPGRPKRR